MSDATAQPVSCWQLRRDQLSLSHVPLLMGIVNVTPDSFSDGGRFLDPTTAIDHALALAESGADLLDIGGESTRPYSRPVETQEELQRVLPVVRAVCNQTNIPVSIDTSKAAVARAALDAGAQVVNDVTGLEGDPAMLGLVVRTGAGVCAMHMQGTPATMQDDPAYDDVVTDIHHYLRQRRDALLEAGVEPQRICLDPGIGFGKTHQHNLQLLANCRRFLDLGCPILIGHSRKGFIAHVLGDKQVDRLPATIGVSLALAAQGVQILRVHDVAPIREALRLFSLTGGLGPGRPTLT